MSTGDLVLTESWAVVCLGGRMDVEFKRYETEKGATAGARSSALAMPGKAFVVVPMFLALKKEPA